MNAIDTNVLVYSFDTDDPVRQQQAIGQEKGTGGLCMYTPGSLGIDIEIVIDAWM